MDRIKQVAVYLGSAVGSKPIFKETAYSIGKELASRGYSIVYGGAGIGTMKALADGALSVDGEVIGVIPQGFVEQIHHKHPNREVLFNELEKVIIVKDMSERKQKMEEISDCCIILPGGGGTMDEFFEYFVDHQLGYHSKPMFLMNLNGFYNPIIDLLETMKVNGFITEENINYLTVVSSVEELITRIENI